MMRATVMGNVPPMTRRPALALALLALVVWGWWTWSGRDRCSRLSYTGL
jgi:hypothetical protein